MSSPTEMVARDSRRRAEAAVKRARLAPVLSGLAGVAGLGLLVAFVVQAGMFNAFAPAALESEPQIDKPEQISTQNSRLAGFDKDRQPYELSAATGYQDKERPELVHMEQVVGQFRKQSGRSYQILSKTGLYDTKLKQMDLAGDVRIIEPGTMTARMATARIAVESKSLVTDSPVEVVMGSGRITANGMKISDDGTSILFLNGVKARFGGDGKGDQPK